MQRPPTRKPGRHLGTCRVDRAAVKAVAKLGLWGLLAHAETVALQRLVPGFLVASDGTAHGSAIHPKSALLSLRRATYQDLSDLSNQAVTSKTPNQRLALGGLLFYWEGLMISGQVNRVGSTWAGAMA